ncbi:MFS transporter [Odoribacter laneus]|jgi:MFS transporter|uniref:Drug:H+ antiporter-2 (14 Spanner) (DHA2) family drug resistance MFS transporter n=1 Tax=Odoribacter laneus YIT 12061 TaxID=742817 RepID=H1DIX3_9BACT|nr:MFS transporter [Odoribacter laneus]MBS1446308.1 MFS transporter [Odoribacter sp.]EHP46735.1 drug:H+ antiporter-2 (14 Spanner) (DHA2) family drug resistance MFS transporter [Odoribacter laneus YIT 12061]CCZ80995.1 drug:H+ antiporter-2 (14 Spanner) (DHA2) family drug resistance MFS transporter [Odoribacter laneus CAG:561]GKI23559.1 MFS transporter [Odoribacter laneus]GKI25546.1 MFS transporter [Odoribacter laneus]
MTKDFVQDGIPKPQRNWAMAAISVGISVAVLDGAIANVALPTIAGDLHVNPASSIWVVNAFQLAVTISLLAFSSLGDLWGYKKVYVGGLLLFSTTSLICALSDSFWTLVIARGLQGFGAAAITSVNTALLRIIYPTRLLPRGMGTNALIIAVAAAAGPTVAAGILSVANWPWLFAINVPIGLIAFGLSAKFLPANPVKVEGQRFDVTSAILNALTFGLLISVIDGFAHDIHWYILIPGIFVMLTIGYFFIRRQLHHPFPLLPIDLMHNRIFSLSVVTSVVAFIAQMLALVSIPFFFQRVLHLSEVATGLLLTPWPLATMISAPLAGRLMSRINGGLLGGIGLAIFGLALCLLALLPAHPTHFDIIWRMVVGGIGFGTFLTPNNSTIIASAPSNRSGGASGMLGMARLLGQTIGAAIAALMFAFFPGNSMKMSLLFGAGIAIVSAIVSSFRKTTVGIYKKTK